MNQQDHSSLVDETRSIKRILLLGLPAVIAEGDKSFADENALHLGLAYIGAMLRSHKFEVKILDCYAEEMANQRQPADNGWVELGLSNEQIIEYIRKYSPDLIGISIPFSCQHYVAHDIAKYIKQSFPGMPIIAGGNHVTAIPQVLNKDYFDFLIIGEAEYSIINLIAEIEHCINIRDIPRVYPGGYPQNEYINNLDDLPFPALDLLPLSKLWHSRRRWINMIASRGCIYDCNFCSIHTVMGYTIRRRSVENVIAEIIKWKNEYNIQEIYFEDDNLTVNKRWAKELFKRIADLRLGIRLYARNGIRADSIDKELLLLMKAAGFQDFMIAPESGSQRTLDEVIDKKMKLEDCEKAIRLANEVGLGVNTFFVLGFPEETWEDLETTVRYAKHLKDLGAVGFWLSAATPYPGTRLYQECVKRGLIDPDNLDFRKLRTPDYVINHAGFRRKDLMEFRNRAMEELLPPKRSLLGLVIKGITLLRKDPSLFYKKLRYKLHYYH